jgi:hypothetical protein
MTETFASQLIYNGSQYLGYFWQLMMADFTTTFFSFLFVVMFIGLAFRVFNSSFGN